MRVLDYNSFINQDRQKIQSVNEHLWSGIIHRSETGEEREEDKIRTKEDIQRTIQEIIDKTHPKAGDTIDLNHLDVSRVEDMSNLFYDEYNDIDFTDYNFNVSGWDVSNVTDMNGMFYDCWYFDCDLSKWNVSSVGDMSYMFGKCTNFNSDLSRWNVSSVGDMSYMFEECTNFNSDLSRWNVSNVRDMGCIFDSCDSLEKIPDWYNDWYND